MFSLQSRKIPSAELEARGHHDGSGLNGCGADRRQPGLGLLLQRIGLAARVCDAKVQLRSFDRRS
jgi:hypothetical protein